MKPQTIYELINDNLQLKIMPYGATLLSLKVKAQNEKWLDVVLGHDDLENYSKYQATYFGACIGQNANRINHASFNLKGKKYQLEKNEGENNLHSGSTGFHQAEWRLKKHKKDQLVLALTSTENQTGFPGKLEVTVTYKISGSELSISFEGSADQTTIFNPTNHSYFNLNGHASGSIENHFLTLNADSFTPIDATFIPTGEIRKVDKTPFDFRKEKIIGKEIIAEDDQLRLANGYDHNYVLTQPDLASPFVKVIGNETGLQLEVSTNSPGVQFYTGNSIPKMLGKEKASYQARSGFCLETQCFPDAMNQKGFASELLEPDNTVSYTTKYLFS